MVTELVLAARAEEMAEFRKHGVCKLVRVEECLRVTGKVTITVVKPIGSTKFCNILFIFELYFSIIFVHGLLVAREVDIAGSPPCVFPFLFTVGGFQRVAVELLAYN